jgi:hypothetical protein
VCTFTFLLTVLYSYIPTIKPILCIKFFVSSCHFFFSVIFFFSIFSTYKSHSASAASSVTIGGFDIPLSFLHVLLSLGIIGWADCLFENHQEGGTQLRRGF